MTLSRIQIRTLNRLLTFKNSVITNSLNPDEDNYVWLMNGITGIRVAKAYAGIVVNRFYKVNTDLPETSWMPDVFAGSPVFYSEDMPQDVIGFSALENANALADAEPEDFQALFNEAGRQAQAYKDNKWGIQFVVGIEA